MASEAHHFCLSRDGSTFHGFQIIYLHLDRRDASAARARHVSSQAARRVCERSQNASVNDSMDLQVAFINFHVHQHAAGPGIFGRSKFANVPAGFVGANRGTTGEGALVRQRPPRKEPD